MAHAPLQPQGREGDRHAPAQCGRGAHTAGSARSREALPEGDRHTPAGLCAMCNSAPLTAPVFSLPTSVREVQRHRSHWQQLRSIVALSAATIFQHKLRKCSRRHSPAAPKAYASPHTSHDTQTPPLPSKSLPRHRPCIAPTGIMAADTCNSSGLREQVHGP